MTEEFIATYGGKQTARKPQDARVKPSTNGSERTGKLTLARPAEAARSRPRVRVVGSGPASRKKSTRRSTRKPARA